MASFLSKLGLVSEKHERVGPPAPAGFTYVDSRDLEDTNFGFDNYLLSGSAKMTKVKDGTDPIIGPVFEITIDPHSAVVLVVDDRTIGMGTKAIGSFIIWKQSGSSEIRARVSRFGGKSENEQTVLTRNVEQNIVSVDIEHDFKHAHPGARLQLDTRTERTSFLIAKLNLTLEHAGI
ncbi:MAG: hypothetical protein ABNH53_05585 [Henriciella sp.]|jgi:hypothetical protein